MARTSTFLLRSCALVLVLAAGCDCGNDPPGGLCPDGTNSCGQACEDLVAMDAAPTACGQACDVSTPCPTGFYCDGGQCTADCLATDDEFCPGGICTTDGHCFIPMDGGTDAGDSGNECAGNVPVTTVTPNVVFLVDQSGSMNADFDPAPGTQTRWDVVRDALIGTGDPDFGIIGDLEASVRFGVVLYTNPSDSANSPLCPALTPFPDVGGEVSIALNNYTAIEAGYSLETYEDNTPTGDSMNALVATIDAALIAADPTIIILATDGEPDRCEDPNPGNQAGADAARQEAINAVAAAYAADIRTFPLAVGGDVGDDHMMDIAVAGITGVARNVTMGSAPATNECDATDLANNTPCFYRPDSATLRDALLALVQGQRSCRVDLNNAVTTWDTNCANGVVTLDLDGPGGAAPTQLFCGNANGFHMLNNQQFTLDGTACTNFLNTPEAVIDASFPCDVIIVD